MKRSVLIKILVSLLAVAMLLTACSGGSTASCTGTPQRLGYLPVAKAARLGVHKGQAQQLWVNTSPLSIIRLILGVGILSPMPSKVVRRNWSAMIIKILRRFSVIDETPFYNQRRQITLPPP